MAWRNKGIPRNLKGNNVLILDSLDTYLSDTIPRSLPSPTGFVLYGNYSVRELPFEVDGNSTLRWALGHNQEWEYDFYLCQKKSLFNRHIFVLVCCPLLVHENDDIILRRTLPAVRRLRHVLERQPPSKQSGKRYNMRIVAHSQSGISQEKLDSLFLLVNTQTKAF